MGFNIMDLQRGRGPVQAKSKADEQDGRACLKYIDVDDLVPSEKNFYPMSAIEELAALLEISGGVKQPGLVMPLGGGKYKLLAGHRRRLASKRLVNQGKEEYRKMPCMVETAPVEEAENPEDTEALRKINEGILVIAMNGQREKPDWVKVREATELRALLEQRRRYEKVPGQTRKIIAEQLGTTPAQVGRYESIAKHLIPEFQREMEAERVNISVGYELSILPEREQRAALEEYREKGALSVEDVRRRRQKEKPAAHAPEPPAEDATQPEPEPPAGDTMERERQDAEEEEPKYLPGVYVREVETSAALPLPPPPSPLPAPVQGGDEPERMTGSRARLVLEDLRMYCEEMLGIEGERAEAWMERADALTVAIDTLRK